MVCKYFIFGVSPGLGWTLNIDWQKPPISAQVFAEQNVGDAAALVDVPCVHLSDCLNIVLRFCHSQAQCKKAAWEGRADIRILFRDNAKG
jgi:hypothetical protein